MDTEHFFTGLHHPDYFSACVPLSAAVDTDETMNKFIEKKLFTNLYGLEKNSKHWQQNSILQLLETISPKDLYHIHYYIDCGDDDRLLHGNYLVHEIMQKKNIKHEFRVRDGGHNWTYWRSALPNVLEFVSKQFNKN